MLIGLQHETNASADASTVGTSVQQRRQDNVQVVRLLHDFLQSRMNVKASAQIIDTADEKKSYKAYCFPASSL